MAIVCAASELDAVALFRHFPELRDRVPWAPLGVWPTPIEPLRRPNEVTGGEHIFIKREDLSSPVYGGNKVRTLEAHMGRALAEGATRIWTTGAFGSNHAVATVLHAPRAGLDSGVMLFPQPPTVPALENLSATLSSGTAIAPVKSVVRLPLVMHAVESRSQSGEHDYVMFPGGATPVGALGHVSAALELAEQIEAGACPLPMEIVLAVGSTCTTAGLLVGIHVAARLGIGWGGGRSIPHVTAVRVTPWPVTSPVLIARLAARTSRLLASLIGDVADVALDELRSSLTVSTRYFGRGYGRPIPLGRRAARAMTAAGGPPLDSVYTAKSAAALFDLAKTARGPLLYWATKSSAPLPRASLADLERATPAMRDFLAGDPR